MKKINTTKTQYWTGYKRNLLPPPRCENCEEKCLVLYDSHHDEYFSLNCGLVIMEQGLYKLPYPINYTYNSTKKRKKRKYKKNDNNNSTKRQKK